MFHVIIIEKELNYFSRVTRDIMLGNSYDDNMKKLQNTKHSILKNFKGLEDTTKNVPDEKRKLAELKESKDTMMAFIDDGFLKMESSSNVERTPAVLASMYEKYKIDATPLANASRDLFSKIVKIKEKDK